MNSDSNPYRKGGVRSDWNMSLVPNNHYKKRNLLVLRSSSESSNKKAQKLVFKESRKLFVWTQKILFSVESSALWGQIINFISPTHERLEDACILHLLNACIYHIHKSEVVVIIYSPFAGSLQVYCIVDSKTHCSEGCESLWTRITDPSKSTHVQLPQLRTWSYYKLCSNNY